MKYSSLVEYIEKTGVTQVELANQIGISQPHLNQILSGNKRPSPEVAARIEEISGVPFRSLLLPDNNVVAFSGANQCKPSGKNSRTL